MRGNRADWELEEYAKIEGRLVDDTLLTEMVEVADEYGTWWGGDNKPYEELAKFVRKIADYGRPLADYDAEDIYAARKATIEDAYTTAYLTEDEIEYWELSEAEVDKPFIWSETTSAEGWTSGVANSMLGLMMLISIALAPIFARELQLRTAPMIRTSRYGRDTLYFAKIAAGMTFICLSVIVVLGSFLAVYGAMWGSGSLETAVQLIFPFAAMPMSVGTLTVILSVLIITASCLISAMTMLISELTRNVLAVMGIMIGGYMGLFVLANQIPLRMRALSQALMILPSTLVSPRLVYEFRLLHIGGRFLRTYQAAPVLYMLAAGALILIGRVLNRRLK